MSMWSKLKVALLTATVGLSAMQFGGCLNLDWNTILRYVAIGSIFD
ncbi:MAG TPA: hypothetical protein PKG54_07020 [Phycisphaerae bacterium]|jgi:hypothetical protein|nr:hypothetical protein [Phycisphaerae bacterium]HOB74260.1 hypothetical protein [Phycisphaerae bacterium]HOJ53149.1 hypothetical protein [Phycisphaerae bacterium]HOL24886.1 hypothetical protein [Phycisphaerae bacterium]HPP19422.1 hypothetical protein [Phycisphaerae bacterium]